MMHWKLYNYKYINDISYVCPKVQINKKKFITVFKTKENKKNNNLRAKCRTYRCCYFMLVNSTTKLNVIDRCK